MHKRVEEMLDALQLPYNSGCINYIVNSYEEECDECGHKELDFAMLKDYWIKFVAYLMK